MGRKMRFMAAEPTAIHFKFWRTPVAVQTQIAGCLCRLYALCFALCLGAGCPSSGAARRSADAEERHGSGRNGQCRSAQGGVRQPAPAHHRGRLCKEPALSSFRMWPRRQGSQLASHGGHAGEARHSRSQRSGRLPAGLRQRRLARYLSGQRLDLRCAGRQGDSAARRAVPQQSRRNIHRSDAERPALPTTAGDTDARLAITTTTDGRTST